MTAAMKAARIGTWIWVLVYAGLIVGGALIVAGALLIWLRSRINADKA